jgi:spermidine/putrescine transport system permease protein
MVSEVAVGGAVDERHSAPERRPRRRWRPGRGVFVVPPLVLVIVFLLGPVVLIALYSVNLRTNIPGTPTATSFANWKDFTTGPGNPFRGLFLHSLEITLLVSVLVTAAAYPLAYFLAFVARKYRYTLLLVLLAPFFTSYLLRVIAWNVMLSNNGVINSLVQSLGLRPKGDAIQWLIFSNFSVALVLFYSWIPFVALPIFAVLENMDRSLVEAATDLGASRFTAFWRVTFPLSLPGVIAGFVFVMIPTTGEFITPLLVGGPSSRLFGNAIQDFFTDSPDWNYGSVLAVTLIAAVILLMLAFGRFLNTDLRQTSEGPNR